jgi:hypothetical protein
MCGHGSFNRKENFTMATATNEVERIVRRVLKEEQGETIAAVQELSTLLTEQVIPRLSNDADREPEWTEDDDAEQDDSEQSDVMSLSGLDDERPTSRRPRPSPNGHDEADETDPPELEIPRAVAEAFATLYKTLSPEQASALAELFTMVDSELDEEGNAGEERNEEARVHA